MILIKEINANQTYPIRLAVLRPTKTLADCVFTHDDDESTFHLGAFLENDLACIGSLYQQKHTLFKESNQWQLRGMATLPQYVGKGLGSTLLKNTVEILLKKDTNLLWCNARSSAVAFYQKAGFSIVGEEFLIADVGPHYVMYLRF